MVPKKETKTSTGKHQHKRKGPKSRSEICNAEEIGGRDEEDLKLLLKLILQLKEK
jgi:hypothetical protein